jgi:LysR family cyn operon transcriptional activator
VQEGTVQLGIAALPAPPPLRADVLFPARILAILPPGLRMGRHGMVDIRDLAGERLLLLQRTFATRQIVDGAFQSARLHPHVALESGTPQCLITLAEHGYGIAILPSTVALRDGKFRIAPLVNGNVTLGFSVGLCHDPRRFLPAYAAHFAEQLRAYTAHTYPGKRFGRRPGATRPK